MVKPVHCMSRYAVNPDVKTTSSATQDDTTSPKPSFTSDYYQCSYVPEEKHGSVLGFLAKTVVGLGVIAGTLVGLSRIGSFKELIGKELGENPKFFERIKKGLAEGGNFIERNVKKAYSFCKDKIKGEGGTHEEPAKPATSNEENVDTSG